MFLFALFVTDESNHDIHSHCSKSTCVFWFIICTLFVLEWRWLFKIDLQSRYISNVNKSPKGDGNKIIVSPSSIHPSVCPTLENEILFSFLDGESWQPGEVHSAGTITISLLFTELLPHLCSKKIFHFLSGAYLRNHWRCWLHFLLWITGCSEKCRALKTKQNAFIIYRFIASGLFTYAFFSGT